MSIRIKSKSIQWSSLVFTVVGLLSAVLAVIFIKPLPGKLLISSVPNGATISIDGQSRGITPIAITLRGGRTSIGCIL